MCNSVLLFTMLVCNVILNSGLPLKSPYSPIFESKTQYQDNKINQIQYEKVTNQTIMYTDKKKRSVDKITTHQLVKNISERISFQEPFKAKHIHRNIEKKKNSQGRVKMQVNDYIDFSNNSYDYQGLLEEYYMESKHDAQSIEAYQPLREDLNETNVLHLVSSLFSIDTSPINCTTTNDIGLRAIICLIKDINSNKQPVDLAKRFWKITKIWFIVYLVVAVPLWCTKGWCCCCLTCKFFKPQQTIDEARKFLLLNPPGVYQKRNGREIHYNPSEREKQCYEEFEHLIKTL